MTDYEDYNVWTDAYTEEHYIGSEREFSRDELIEMIDQCTKDATKAGLENVKVHIGASIDYDDFSYAYIRGSGKRKLSQHEIDKVEENKAITALSVKLGCTFYEACVVLRLQEKGKVVLSE